MGAAPVLLLGYDYWQERYRGDPAVVGRVLRMNDRPHRIVGVLPPLPRFPEKNDVFMPVSSCPFRSGAGLKADRGGRMLTLVGRLAPGVSLPEASADIEKATHRIRAEYADAYRDLPGYRVDVTSLDQEITRRARPVLFLLFATTGFVLLIACSNVFNLMLAQLSKRDGELALRAAIGADQRRILRQLASEATLLTLSGGALGLAIAWAATGLLQSLAARLSPRVAEVRLDSGLLGFALALSIGAGLLFGIVPGIVARRRLQTARSSRSGVPTLLVVGQLAASLVLLSAAGLTLKSLYRLERVDVGFETEHVLTMLIDLDWSRYRDADSVREFQDKLLDRLSADDGVVVAALGRTFPLGDRAEPMPGRLRIEGSSGGSETSRPLLDLHSVSAEYFRTLGVPLSQGRYFDESDDASSPLVAIVNRAAATRYWPHSSPLGKRVSPDGEGWYRVVGVVGDVRQYRIDADAAASVYFALSQVPMRVTELAVRTVSDPLETVDTVKSVVRRLDPEQAVANTSTLDEARRERIQSPQLTTTLLATFAGLALLISLVGLSGLLGLSVERRSREIGLRLVLGASPSDVFLRVMRHAATVLGGGLLIGLPAALMSSSLLSGFLFQVEPHDPLTFSMVSIVFVLASFAACLIPARRATSIESVGDVTALTWTHRANARPRMTLSVAC